MSAHGNGAATNGHSSPLTDERKLAELLGWASVGLGVPQVTSPMSLRPLHRDTPGREAAVLNSRRQERTSTTEEQHAMDLKAAITVRRAPEEVYAFWRDFQNLPRFMYHLESVEASGDGRTHWKIKAPLGSVQWDAEVTEERLNELISWRSVEGSKFDNSGSVRFTPAPRNQGTEIRLELHYDVPGGALTTALAKVLGEDPIQQVKDDLRRFKQVMKTGEVVRSGGQPGGPERAPAPQAAPGAAARERGRRSQRQGHA